MKFHLRVLTFVWLLGLSVAPAWAGATNLTTTNVQAQGADWTAAIWQANGVGTAVAPVAGNTYTAIFNGTGVGNNLNNTRVRSPAVSGTVTFAGDALTLNTNTELRTKGTPPTTLNFPGVSGRPGLILNGGLLNDGDNTATTVATLTGSIQVTGQSYDSAQGVNGGGGGLATNLRALTLAANLSGSGNLVIMNCSTNLPQIISGASNTFSGQWIVQCGWLQGATSNSLGTNSITVDPHYTGYLAAMPNASSPSGPALLEVDYNINSSGTLALTNGGLMNLHQNCTFASVSIQGTALSPGTHSYAQLVSNFPATFLPNGSGSITVTVTGALPLATNESATAIGATTATFNGQLLTAGAAAIILYYGPVNGSTNATNWASSIPLGLQTGAFSKTVTGLSPNTAYFFTFAAMNAAGVQWAAPSLSFTTEAIALPQVTNAPATGVGATAATLNGQVLAAGNATTGVILYYGTTDGATNAADWAFAIPLGPQSGAFGATVTGLSSNTTYFFTAAATNAAGIRWAAPSLSFTTLASNPPPVLASVLTYKYDNSRAGADTNEVILTPANVNSTNFARLFTYAVDGYCYAEPLYVAGLQIPGRGTHNVVFVSTENDSIYAFDADSNAGADGGLLWSTNLGIAQISVNNYATRYYHNVLNPLIGITGTPVIDPVSGTLFVDTFVGPIANTNSGYHVLHALNITNGAEQPFSPVLVHASVPGTGVDAVNGVVTFAPSNQMNRPAMTLVGGTLYLAYGSYGDTDPYHGWVMGYNATNLQPLANSVYATTPNASISAFGVNAGEGALWMGGNGLCADANGNLYFETANGSFSANTNGGDYGDCFVKLSSTNGLAVADYFAPWNENSMAVNDLDLGSGGPILLPDAVGSAAHPHLMVGAGKEGTIYLVDRDNLGHYIITTTPTATKDTQIVQELQSVIGGIWGSPAYWNHLIFWQGSGDVLKAFAITNGVMTTAPVSQSGVSISGYTVPCISANGTSNGIAWLIDVDAYNNNGPGGNSILYAFNATNLSQELYNSSDNLARDNPGGPVKYAVPIVANGKVYVKGQYTLSVFGIGNFPPAPAIAPAGGVFTNSVTVTLTDTANTALIYYTLDGTAPTTQSLVYSGPFTLTNSAAVNAMAVNDGLFDSATVSATFINSSSIGSGTGLLGQYFANTSASAFNNPTFNNLATLVRTDATINFDWGTAGPSGNVGATNYVVRWTGAIQPQFSQTYTFSTISDDGVRLYVNGQLLIDDFVNQPATIESNSITLAAQQLYNIELDYYYQNDNGSQVSLSWSSPSTPLAVVPQAQLYPYTNPPPTLVLSSPSNGSVYTGAASVTIEAMADAPYNPVSRVDFYANGNWLGGLDSSPNAPLYSLTTTGFNPQPGGESANSAPASATPIADLNLTTTNVQPAGPDWTAAIWQTNGIGTAVAPAAGQTYTLVGNGTSIGNGLNSTRVRSPAAASTATFPGDALTLNTNTELRAKFTTSTTLNFPGVGANPGLILNGGIINDGADGLATITGTIWVASQSYDSAQGENGGGGGLAPNPRAFTISAALAGPGNLVIMNCSTNLPQIISGASNAFSGQWVVQCGWLQGATPNSLGTNSITVDPLYTGYLTAMPNATSPPGPALFEVDYDLTSTGTLTLANGGMMNLHQNCTFAAATITGTSLAPGTHTYAELSSNFPANFLPNGSGSITVSPTSIALPGPVSAPTGLNATPGPAQVYLSWTASSGATNYNVKRATSASGPFVTVASTTGTSYTDTPVANGATYFYVVSALSAPGYTLIAVATDGSGLRSTSPPVQILINSGSGLPYGLTTNAPVTPFFNMPAVIPASLPGTVPPLLSQTGVFANTASRTPVNGFIPYAPNTPLFSDNAVKSRYLAVPNLGGLVTPAEQIAFQPTNSWTFPAGTVFVKNFDLVVNATNPGVPLRRLETRLLVRNNNGGVYGVTYKWRADNSEADLLTTSLNESVSVTNANGVATQTWYYPSPADCLTCHTPVANYVLGLNTRQLNGNLSYPATGNTDNQLRTLNRLGLFYPAINEADIANYAQLSSLTNLSASPQQRARSYLDVNCAQCHQPGGVGITFDARYDTPLANQNITNFPAQLPLGFDNACIIKAEDIWRSMICQRMNTTNATTKMPTLARNLIDTNAVQVMTEWINGLPGTPALAPPLIAPNGGTFIPSVAVALLGPDTNAALYYTLDGTRPTTNSLLYTAPVLLTNSAAFSANAFEAGFANSVAASAQFNVQPHIIFTSVGFNAAGAFQLGFLGMPGTNYVLQTTTDFINWTALTTNQAANNFFDLVDPGATNSPHRFYRVLQQ